MGGFSLKSAAGVAAGALGAPLVAGVGGEGVAAGVGYIGAREQRRADRAGADKAMEFETSSAREAMDFERRESEIDRQFQKDSGRNAMEFERSEADKAMAFEANSAKEQMRFQKEMSDTSYQRSMADLKAAGLNPMLAYQQGGAHSPGGQQAPVFNRGNSSAGSIHSAAQVENVRAQTELVNAQKAKVVAETGGAEATSSRLKQELIDLVPSQIRTGQLEAEIRDAAAYWAQREKAYAMTEGNDKAIQAWFAAKFGMLPAQVRAQMAEIVIKELAAKAGRVADAGFEGVKRFSEYAGETLGKVTNSAVDAGRRVFRGYQRAQSNARFRNRDK